MTGVQTCALPILCVSGYLGSGLKQMEKSDSLVRKQIKVQFGDEFFDFIVGLETDGMVIKLEQLYNDFLAMSGFDKKEYSNKRFVKAIEESCTLMKIAYLNKREKASGGKKVYRFFGSEVAKRDFERNGYVI